MKKPKKIAARYAKKGITKVAMITLTVPGSESIDIVERELKALDEVKYPHDSWILVDKVHSPEIKTLAEKYNVRYFCRHDVDTWGEEKVAYWNQPIPPFKAKTKAGNVNAWIDAYGSEYSHFTQLDIDHIPVKNYLDSVLGYFSDPNVAWVQAPSVYGNLDNWTARGSVEQEFILQGPLQMGFYGATSTPFIIGSHATYKMSAIQEIGGFQPTRAEDHLDTLYLAAKGYTGVFLPEIIATGDGPETFETYLAQQFAWAYSLMQVLMFHTPKMIWKLKPQLALQMLFCETWYPLWSMSMIVLFLSPIVALLSNQHIAIVSFWEFMIRSAFISVVAFIAWFWSRRWHKPQGVMLSWRGIILHMARWAMVFNANIQALLNVKKPYMITQKGSDSEYILNSRALLPYLILGGLSLLANVFYLAEIKTGNTQGYLLFNLEGAFFMLIVCIIPFMLSIQRTGKSILSNQKINLFLILIGVYFLSVMSTYSQPAIMIALNSKENTAIASAKQAAPSEAYTINTDGLIGLTNK